MGGDGWMDGWMSGEQRVSCQLWFCRSSFPFPSVSWCPSVAASQQTPTKARSRPAGNANAWEGDQRRPTTNTQHQPPPSKRAAHGTHQLASRLWSVRWLAFSQPIKDRYPKTRRPLHSPCCCLHLRPCSPASSPCPLPRARSLARPSAVSTMAAGQSPHRPREEQNSRWSGVDERRDNGQIIGPGATDAGGRHTNGSGAFEFVDRVDHFLRPSGGVGPQVARSPFSTASLTRAWLAPRVLSAGGSALKSYQFKLVLLGDSAVGKSVQRSHRGRGK